jgi:hypothetical protein
MLTIAGSCKEKIENREEEKNGRVFLGLVTNLAFVRLL